MWILFVVFCVSIAILLIIIKVGNQDNSVKKKKNNDLERFFKSTKGVE